MTKRMICIFILSAELLPLLNSCAPTEAGTSWMTAREYRRVDLPNTHGSVLLPREWQITFERSQRLEGYEQLTLSHNVSYYTQSPILGTRMISAFSLLLVEATLEQYLESLNKSWKNRLLPISPDQRATAVPEPLFPDFEPGVQVVKNIQVADFFNRLRICIIPIEEKKVLVLKMHTYVKAIQHITHADNMFREICDSVSLGNVEPRK